MESLVISFLMALTGIGDDDDDPVCVVVLRPRAYLADLLGEALEGREGLEVVVDRRYDERRKWQQPVTVERRRAQRRLKEEVVEVVIGRVNWLGGPREPLP